MSWNIDFEHIYNQYNEDARHVNLKVRMDVWTNLDYISLFVLFKQTY